MINSFQLPQPEDHHGHSAPPHPPCQCDRDPVEALKKLFVDYFQAISLVQGRAPATRPVFLRLHGIVNGHFEVADELPDELQIGLFRSGATYPMWVRFSSDVQPGTSDLRSTIGVGIKLFGVDGPKLLAPEEHARTHDFILQNHDVFFLDTAADMCELTCLSLNGRLDEYLASHPITAQILADMEKQVETVLQSPYWSVLPYRYGERYVKYKLQPEMASDAQAPIDFDDPFYLASDLAYRLNAGGARFRFLIQFQTNDDEMPLDRATVRWNEEASAPVHVATLVLPRQDIRVRNQSEYGENLAFNPWHALAAHEPVGSINAARKVVYTASAAVRRNFNGVPIGEPNEPRPVDWQPDIPYPPAKDTRIVRATIHPAIGVTRVGNSRTQWFLGPEVIEPMRQPLGFYRDEFGGLKRQVARFRIYGYNEAGEVVRELTLDWAAIRWTVHVANRKASWYRWQMALDVPEAAALSLPRRNKNITDPDARLQLEIDPGARSIEGRNQQGDDKKFWGRFQSTPVYLGEAQTDDEGRLLVFPGFGTSASPTGSPIYTESESETFINADGWYDDIADGPIAAEVSIEGRPIPVEPAWVLSAPPNYAPMLQGLRTLYDLLFDLYVQNAWLDFPAEVSFSKHIYPLFRRLSDLQWVNKGFAAEFGHQGPHDFNNRDFVRRLATLPQQGKDPYGELRRQIFHSFRDPEATDNNQIPWPWIYGDAMDIPPANTPRQNATISPTQYRILRAWAQGHFIDDWSSAPDPPTNLDRVPVELHPDMLDRAALDYCLADAFHPGCEVTWPIRHLSMFSRPFRIRHQLPGQNESDYGAKLTPLVVLSATGPLHAQRAGGLTRWLGLPWQADSGFCRAGYDRSYDPYVPSFWPARVPNQVLTLPNYERVLDPTLAIEARVAAFANRFEWVDPIDAPNTAGQMLNMVRVFGDMGVLEVRDGVTDDADFPETLMVASFGPAIPAPLPITSPSGLPIDHNQGTSPAPDKAAQGPAGLDRHDRRPKAPLPVMRPPGLGL